MKRLIEDVGLGYKLAKSGQDMVINDFSREKMIDDWIKGLYESIR